MQRKSHFSVGHKGLGVNSHQISQSTYSLLFFRGQIGYKSKTVVEDTLQKNKTMAQRCFSCLQIESFLNGA